MIHQLEGRDLKVKQCLKAQLSMRQLLNPHPTPRKQLEAVAVDREEDFDPVYQTQGSQTLSKDAHATSLKKGRKSG